MAITLATSPTAEVSTAAIQDLIAAQQRFFRSGTTRNVEWRLKQLRALKKAIAERQDAILDALHQDLGKHPFEGYATEVGFVLEEIGHTLAHLRDWAAPEAAAVPLTQAISSAKVYKEPFGRVLVIAPWNYPFQLAIAPLVGSICAGNVTIVKPSELAPATSRVVAKLLADLFPREFVAVVEGGIETNQNLLREQHDYIFYTGSTAVGKIVMKAAAEHLTPVTLELGGKSPCIVDYKTPVGTTARRIAWGKWVNCGQTCVAPDYLLVHENLKDKLLPALKEAVEKMYGADPKQSPDYGRMVNDRHFARVASMLSQGQVYFGGQTDEAQRYIAPTLLLNPDLSAPVMQEEIFGPILPVLTYRNLEEAVSFVNAKERPLALYVFTSSSKTERYVLENTHSGGGCVNDTLVHLSSPELPFGGVGASGMGAYHGKFSFDTFTQRRGFLKKSNVIDMPVRYAPYKNKLKLLRWLMR
jgi:aldehyde dehydrogenase (NAD+)